MLSEFRSWISPRIAVVMFLGFYFLTVVSGNILYALPVGRGILSLTGFSTDSLAFPTSFTFGFWSLLFLPFVAVPLAVFLLRSVFSTFIGRFIDFIPDFTKRDYLLFLFATYFIVAVTFQRVDPFGLAGNTADALAAVKARFALQARTHFFEKVVIHSLLTFLTFYSIVALLKSASRFWALVAVLNVVVTSVVLIAMNMKWPILVFYVGIVVAVFMFSARHAYLKAAVGGAALVVLYLGISSYVFRWVPIEPGAPPSTEVITVGPNFAPPETQKGASESGSQPGEKPDESMNRKSAVSSSTPRNAIGSPAAVPPSVPFNDAGTSPEVPGSPSTSILSKTEEVLDFSTSLFELSFKHAHLLFAHAVNRMAISYPYYYQGSVCESFLVYLMPTRERCRPSYLIYTQIYGKDGFEGRGSAPAAPHITGYAIGGWPVALLAMLGTCVVLAAFSAVPLNASVMAGTIAVVGATVGYHFSQLPGEGPIIYDHGFIWPLLLMISYAIIRYLAQGKPQLRGG